MFEGGFHVLLWGGVDGRRGDGEVVVVGGGRM